MVHEMIGVKEDPFELPSEAMLRCACELFEISGEYLDRSHRQLMNRMFERLLQLAQLPASYSDPVLGRIEHLKVLREAGWKAPLQVGLQLR